MVEESGAQELIFVRPQCLFIGFIALIYNSRCGTVLLFNSKYNTVTSLNIKDIL